MDTNLEYSIDFGHTSIKFTVNRRARKTLGVNVLPCGEVTVDAPINASIEKIKKIVHRRSRWILKQKREIATFHPVMPPKQYMAGETFHYLGEQYRLAVFNSDKNEIILSRNHIEVYLRTKIDSVRIETHLKKWFQKEAKNIFEERLQLCMPKVRQIGITNTPTLRLRKMKTRWGSCTHDGLIILNPELVSASIECIDYVIIHELCHLREHSHNRRFYQLLSTVLPNWKSYRTKLNYVHDSLD